MEIWASIPGYGGHYQASNYGQIRVKDRSVRKYSNFAGKVVEQKYKGRLLKPSKSNKLGHLSVHLGVDGTKYSVHVARLVLEAFVGPCPDGMEACHSNGKASDNCVGNLRWDTHYNNNQDRVLHGTYLIGENHPMAKISASDAIYIYKSKEKGIDLAKKFGLNPSQISAIRLGQIWKSVTKGIKRDE
jgi:hypothetical protein